MKGNDDRDEVVMLLKEIANGLGRLMADHLKLARLELIADAKAIGRRVAILAVVVAFVFLGYVFSCLGLAMVTSRWLGISGGLFLLGGVHLVGGAALLYVGRRLRGMHLMHETAYEAKQSISTLTTGIVNETVSTAAAPERTPSGAQASAAETEGGARVAKPRL